MKENQYILVGSITNAMRGRRILQSEGIQAYLHRDTHPSEGEGCGYSLLVSENLERVVSVLQDNGIRILKIRRAL